MKSIKILLILSAIIIPATTWAAIPPLKNSPPMLTVSLQPPTHPLTMGDMPSFTGRITNQSRQTVSGLVVYLSLVSLEPGHEHPVDLEDWSAQKAIRLDHLAPGETVSQQWQMRLIKSGPFATALTIVDPTSRQPRISPLALFTVSPKATVVAGRILPVSIGMPLFLVGLFFGLYRARR